MADRPITCPRCSGTRTLEVNSYDPTPCPECDGTGWVMQSDENEDEERLGSSQANGSQAQESLGSSRVDDVEPRSVDVR